jgi:tripeptidyl-peptidase-1
MLAADYGNFTHAASSRTYIRTLAYSVPQHLKKHIDYVSPTTDFVPPLERLGEQDHAPAPVYARACDPGSMTPACIQNLYGMPTTVTDYTLSSVGIGDLSGQVSY